MGIIGAFTEGIENGKANAKLARRFREFEHYCKLREQGIDVIPTPSVEAFKEYVEKLLAAEKKKRIGFY